MARTHALTAERLRQLLSYDPETGVFRWRAHAGNRRAGGAAWSFKDGYNSIRVDGVRHRAARLAWLYMTGHHPPHEIDHIDMDRSNDRFSNLRSATSLQNNFNRPAPRTNTSGAKGVVRHRGKWVARIRVAGRHVYLGQFDDVEAAAAAYRAAAQTYHGEFARVA